MAWLGAIWDFVKLVLALLGLREEFLNRQDKERAAEAAEKTEQRNDAVDKQKTAQSEEEFDRAQDDIVSRKP